MLRIAILIAYPPDKQDEVDRRLAEMLSAMSFELDTVRANGTNPQTGALACAADLKHVEPAAGKLFKGGLEERRITYMVQRDDRRLYATVFGL